MIATPAVSSGLSRRLLMGACLLGAVGVRLPHIADPPLEFHPARQFRGAIRARSLYWERVGDRRPWELELARLSLAATQEKEPPVMETLAAAAYLLGGGERLWIPRVLAALFWGLGAVVLYALNLRLFGREGVLLGPFLFLFLPFAVNVGRAFMPEALLTATFLAAALAIVRHRERPTSGRLLAAAGAAALAVLVKLVVIFPLLAAFVACAWRGRRLRDAVLDRDTRVFAALAAAPGLVYYAVEMLRSPMLRGVLRSNFIPGLWLQPLFWTGWLTQIGSTTGWIPFALAIVALLRLRDRSARALLLGLLGGHLAYAAVFTYAIATHDYYHVAFFAAVMVMLGAWGPSLSRAVRAPASRWAGAAALAAAGATAAVVLAAAVAVADVPLLSRPARARLALPAAFLCGNQMTSWTPEPPADLEKDAARIGEVVGHSTNTIFLAYEYGAPLCYFGGVFGKFWPDERDVWARGLRGVPPLAADERFTRGYRRLGAEYFIVEDMRKWAAQPDLQAFLRARFAVVAETPSFVVFDLRGSARGASTGGPP